jgi:hypothetical protein
MNQPRIPLEVLRIEEPCTADWNAMAGDDRRRFCGGCKKFVHNLSAMSRVEAEQLICASAGELCVRLTRTADGIPVTVEYEASLRNHPRRGWPFWTGLGLVGALVAGVAQAVTGRAINQTRIVMGGVRYCPPIMATRPATQPVPATMASIPDLGEDPADESGS